MATLAQTILAAFPANTCKVGADKLVGKTAQELYDSYDDIPWSERTPHQWLAQVAVTNPDKANETLVAWLQDTGSRLDAGDIKDRIAALAHDADDATLNEAVAWVEARRKAGDKPRIELAYSLTATYLRDGNDPLTILGPGGCIIKHRVDIEGVDSDTAKQDAYDFLRAQIDFAAFNPGGLA